MSIVDFVKVVLLGIVEGITEWLPVSSTGHLLLLERWISLGLSDEAMDFFLVFIQLGAVLAVCAFYRNLWNPLTKKTREERRSYLLMWGRVILGCIPAGLAGVLLDDPLDKLLSHGKSTVLTVGCTLLVYGVAFVALEHVRGQNGNECKQERTITVKTAFFIGCFQVLSLVPGTSRSGSTILGASLLGAGRVAAAEFSFLMAMPLMLGATLLRGGKLFASGIVITQGEWAILLVGFLTAFFVSLVAVRFLLDFVRRHTFCAFGWYRIGLGLIVLLFALR